MAEPAKREDLLQLPNETATTEESKKRDWRKKLVGRLGEDFVANYFERTGHIIMERNWRPGRFSELDLIVRRQSDELIIFVEVKTRRLPTDPLEAGNTGFDSLNWRKRSKILISARRYLHLEGYGEDVGYQCDAVLVTFEDILQERSGQKSLLNAEILHVPGAFDNP
jgi:Holliday junction resolvase-like predicted endonuclease